MIAVADYVAPEPREPEEGVASPAWELIDMGGVEIRRRWVTQRTLQAVGTGAIVTLATERNGGGWWHSTFHIHRCGSCAVSALVRADQSARIGFGAL